MSTYIPHNPTLGPARPPSEREDHPSTHDRSPNVPEKAEPDQCDEPEFPPDYTSQHGGPTFQAAASDGSAQSESQTEVDQPDESNARIDNLDPPAEAASQIDASIQLDQSESQTGATDQPELLGSQANEDPLVQHELEQRINRYVNAFDKTVESVVRVEKDTVGILEEAYGLWNMCRISEQADAGFMEKCRRIDLTVSDKAGEFIRFLKFVQTYWEKERQPSKEAREAARKIVSQNNRHAAALTGIKIHLMRRYGELPPYNDGTVTELLTNKNTDFGSIEAVVAFAREQLRQPSAKSGSADADIPPQQDEPETEMLISEAERDIAASLHREKHNGVELSLKVWRNGQPTSYRVVSTSSQEIQTLGVSPSTPEEKEAFSSQSKDEEK
jgi:hypothetical protein